MVTTHYARTLEIVIDQRKARGDLPLIRIKPRFVEGYIIPPQFSFQTSSGENKILVNLWFDNSSVQIQ
jgi:hypothetical protein